MEISMANIETRKNGLTFEQWKDRVNMAIIHRTGVEADNLPDWEYHSAWSRGMAPSVAAGKVIANAKRF